MTTDEVDPKIEAQQTTTADPIQETVTTAKKTTIALSAETKAMLTSIRDEMGLPDYDSAIRHTLNQNPTKRSTDANIYLMMPASRFRWLRAGQSNIDHSNCLRDSVI